MAYGFQQDGDLGAELLRVARAQAARLDKLLRDEREPASGHHKTRKCLKRLRGLVLLVRSDIGDRRWRKADRELAAIGRVLSGARDQTVILATLDRVVTEGVAATVREAAASVRGLQRADAAARIDGKHTARESLRHAARQVAERIEDWPIARVSLAGLMASMADEYRSGRAALKTAYRRDTAEDFHQLRKHLQRHGRHMQLLQIAARDEIQVRIDAAKQLSDLLGEDHDLSLLRDVLASLHGSSLQPGIAEIDRLCILRQRAVRLRARPLLQRLYAETPKALARRLKAYWKAAPPEVIPLAPAAEPQHLPPVRTH